MSDFDPDSDYFAQRLAHNLRVKALLRADLHAKTWEEKIASIERMNEAGKIARASMKKTLAEKAAKAAAKADEPSS